MQRRTKLHGFTCLEFLIFLVWVGLILHLTCMALARIQNHLWGAGTWALIACDVGLTALLVFLMWRDGRKSKDENTSA